MKKLIVAFAVDNNLERTEKNEVNTLIHSPWLLYEHKKIICPESTMKIFSISIFIHTLIETVRHNEGWWNKREAHNSSIISNQRITWEQSNIFLARHFSNPKSSSPRTLVDLWRFTAYRERIINALIKFPIILFGKQWVINFFDTEMKKGLWWVHWIQCFGKPACFFSLAHWICDGSEKIDCLLKVSLFLLICCGKIDECGVYSVSARWIVNNWKFWFIIAKSSNYSVFEKNYKQLKDSTIFSKKQ